MDQRESISVLLTARAYVYKLFQSLFGNEPNTEQLNIIDVEDADVALSIFLPEEDNAAKRTVLGILSKAKADDEELLNILKQEYLKLLIGPQKLPAPPWESVYHNRERLILQPSTLEIRNTYRANGFIPAAYPHVADDHIAIELDFMAGLAETARTSFLSEDTAKTRDALTASQSFVKEHLLTWTPEFSEVLLEQGECRLYPQLSALTVQFLQADAQAIEELLQAL